MNTTVTKEIMETYAEITKNTIICLDMQNLKHPLFSIGLDTTWMIEYTEFDEIYSFLSDVLKQDAAISDKPNIFHTFITNNLFTYNIVFLKESKETRIALIAGPVLPYLPDNKSLNRMIIHNNLPYYKKHVFTGVLNNLPVASNERIYQLGIRLLSLSKIDTDHWVRSQQELHGRKISEEVSRLIYLNNAINKEQEKNEPYATYKLSSLLMEKIIHGNAKGIKDIISEYSNLFFSLESVIDNNRSLKNRCIMMCSIACHFAISSNVPYERMINNLWRSIEELEKLKATNDILAHMSATIEEFAHAVFALSDKGYSLHIDRVFNYIKGHLSEKITLKELAEHVQISPVYLSGLIKKETNQSLSYHINRFRIEESKRLLIFSNKSIQEIAYDIGYSYQNHYNTVFKKYEGQTPLEYRKKMGTKNYIDFLL